MKFGRRCQQGWLGCALLGIVLSGCGGSARSSTASTRGISDPAPGGECESTLEFVALGILPPNFDYLRVALDRSSQRAFWSFRSGPVASSFHWSRERGISELQADALAAKWEPAAAASLLQVLSSADGSVGAGEGYDANGAPGFRWSERGEVNQLDLVPHAISRDGAVIAGVQGDQQVVRWTPAGGVEALGIAHGESNVLLAASGEVIAGQDANGHCYRWTGATGSQDLGLLPGSTSCTAALISENGEVVVGVSLSADESPPRPFRWSLAQGMQDLHLGDNAGLYAWPRTMNADGSAIAAELYSQEGSVHQFARWTEATGAEVLSERNLIPTYVSPLGDVVIGSDQDSIVRMNAGHAWADSFRWTEAGGVQSLGITSDGLALDGKLMVGAGPSGPEIRKFGDLGSGARLVDLLPPGIVPEGWSDAQLDGISEDGGLLFGDALNPAGERQTWVQHLSCPAP